MVQVSGPDVLGKVREVFSRTCPACGRRRGRCSIRCGKFFLLRGHGGLKYGGIKLVELLKRLFTFTMK